MASWKETEMKGLTRLVAILAIVLALQLAQSSKAVADDSCTGCDDPCHDCVGNPNDIAWE